MAVVAGRGRPRGTGRAVSPLALRRDHGRDDTGCAFEAECRRVEHRVVEKRIVDVAFEIRFHVTAAPGVFIVQVFLRRFVVEFEMRFQVGEADAFRRDQTDVCRL